MRDADDKVSYTNYAFWQKLYETTDPAALQEQMVWEWELRSYFGLSFDQVQEMKTNWNTYYNDNVNKVINLPPTQEPYIDQTGVAYWQWADSYMTTHSLPFGPSVANQTDTVTGYVEYNYWLKFWCNPENQGAMSPENWAFFGDVQMYRSKSDPSINMEHLWTLQDPVTGGDPAGNSLFNLTSLKTLIDLGQNTINILEDKDKVYLQDFTL